MRAIGRRTIFAIILPALAFLLPACGDADPARIVTPMFKAKDKATWTAARANLDTIRTALGACAAGEGLYPPGPLDYDGLNALLPGANLPPAALDAKFAEFRYEATPGRESYRVTVRTTDREADTLVATPSGVEPNGYPY